MFEEWLIIIATETLPQPKPLKKPNFHIGGVTLQNACDQQILAAVGTETAFDDSTSDRRFDLSSLGVTQSHLYGNLHHTVRALVALIANFLPAFREEAQQRDPRQVFCYYTASE
ncbi:hypothetical protein EDD52_11944 [Primorskyibacter sedentarius]|uniref:Uncharacterized protein n=1 Tax=Primorskyibacter sedentarius TaxID=745311 RepID=A0A4V2UMZ7_9RHOB|nr:hypothetical protein EDD52_11944 [Primorskyibacter sedentarius]